MNRDPEDIQRRLLKLVQDLLPNASLTDGEAVNRILGIDETSLSSPESSNLRSPQNVNLPPSGFIGSNRSLQREPIVELGDVPAVQDRFHALLKHRLQSEIQQNPPLFPWETEFCDYEAEATYGVAENPIGSDFFPVVPRPKHGAGLIWIHHLNAIGLPVSMPRDVLAQLLERCQAIAQSSLKQGSKLVQAVEDLFPQQSEALNYLAGLVIPMPTRSPNSPLSSGTKNNLPVNYETAAPAQQMVLSLLAAREILNALTITLQPDQPFMERQWETDFGPLKLRAVYDSHPEVSSIRVQATLPCSGHLNLQGLDSQVVAQRSTAGLVSVELFSPQMSQVYPLEVSLADQDQTPLTFSISFHQPD
jgi:hypothetical protein